MSQGVSRENKSLPFTQNVHQAALTLIQEYPEWREVDLEEVRRRNNTTNDLMGRQLTSLGYLTQCRDLKFEYVLPTVIEILASEALTFTEEEQPHLRSFVFGVAQASLSALRTEWASDELGFNNSHLIDIVERKHAVTLIPARIAALEKFQNGLLERATPSPARMRR